ncbi:putative MFS-type transporter YhjX [Auxenochlorella protothecoides]|uniref:Putative MFS-type transporter YhjX n=1 Tax=Auxenochlorella protothecoides TaxID=3075 RepID=A0A087SFQ7_AUXPR|nr:putative MFS-type transporter YhjX [Auxenochlorella protothecoides]KFM24561.1 putative MFS-type transporter YhjX [Auxenochlorella protothecoides]
MRPVNKWSTFAASLPIGLSSGIVYCFSIWSADLKAAYHLDQGQLQLVGAAANIGGLAAIFAGLLYDALQDWHQLGPRLVLLLGMVTNLGGYLGLWAVVTGRISPPYWQVCALAAIACSGNTWTDTVVLVTNVRNLPQHRGTVVGIIKSCEGLSASVFTAIYLGVFAPHAKPFLLFMAVAPAVIDLVGTLFVGHVPFIQHSELKRRGRRTFTTERRFAFTLCVLGTVAVYLAATALAASHVSPAVHSVFLPPVRMLLHPNFWLLFWPCFFGMGVGLVFVNNAAQLVQSLHGPPNGHAPLLSLFSVANFAGRVFTGWHSERALHARGTPRPIYLVAFSAATVLVCLGFAASPRATLPLLAPLAGFTFGGTWTLMSTLVSELFGMKHFASNYCAFQLAPAAGSYLLATRLAGALYAAAMRATGQHGTTCLGRRCFATTWLALAVLGLASTGMAAWLFLRTKDAYRAEYEAVHAFDELTDSEDDEE